MKKGWTTKKLIVAGSLSVLTLVFQLMGAGVAFITGVPLTSGLINSLVSPAMLVICLLTIDKKGVATLYMTILGILQLPLPLTGVPGFFPKVIILCLIGIIVDILFFFMKRNKKVASFVIGGVDMVIVGIGTVKIGRLFDMPGIEQTSKLVYSPLIILGFFIGGIGGYFGYFIYQKLKNASVVKRIQA